MVIADAYGTNPFLVGSALHRRDYRDVDVRLILDTTQYKLMFPRGGGRLDPRWSLLCSAISLQLGMATDLPIDFQFQSMQEANEQYGGQQRDPLGIFPVPARAS